MNKQIKVKESPKDWLVLDHYVESGNVEFVSSRTKLGKVIPGIPFTETPIIHSETYGTKHIQLVAANPQASTIYGILAHAKGGVIGNIDVWEKVKLFKKSGKDFFIYKVTEVKNGKI